MGQRFQIIVKTPKVFWNEGNPNNRDEEYYVFHNQWLYGISVIKTMATVFNAVKLKADYFTEHIAGKDKKYPHKYIEYVRTAFKHDNYKDINNIKKTHAYFEETGSDTKWISEQKDWDKVLDKLDNNNGYLFIIIDGKGKITYSLINGYEDSEERKDRTPKEYINLFYTDEQMEQYSDKEFNKAMKYLKKFKQTPYKDVSFPKQNKK